MERSTMPDLAEVATQTRAWACYDCGKCTATCPISRIGGEYSPRKHVLAANARQRDEVAQDAMSGENLIREYDLEL